MFLGLPWYSFLIWAGFGLAGFILGWLLEWVWWRRPYAESHKRAFDLETEVQAAQKEVELARTGAIFNDIRAERDEALQARSKFESDLGARGRELANLQSDHSQLKGEYEGKLAELAQIKADWERRYQLKEAELARALADGQAQLRAKTAELDDANARITLLQNEYAEIEARHAAEAKLRAETETTLAQLDSHKTLLQASVDDLQAQLADLQTKHGAERDQLQAGLQAKEQELGLFKSDYDARLKTAEDEHGNTRGSLGLLQTKFDQAQAEHSGKLAEFDTAAAALNARIESAEAALKAKEDERLQLKAELEARLQNLQGERDGLVNAKADLERQLAGVNNAHGETTSRLTKLQGDFDSLRGEHSSKLGEVVSLTAGAAASLIALKGKDDEITTLTARVNELDATVAARDKQLLDVTVDWEGRLKAKDSEAARLSADWTAQLQSKDEALAKLNADLSAQLAAKEAELARLGDEHGSKIGEIATLTAGAVVTMAALKGKDDEIVALKAQVGELEAAVAHRDSQHLNATADWEGRLKAKDDDVAKLNADWSAQLAAKDADLARLGDEHGSKIGEIATLTAGAAATLAVLKGKDDEIASLTVRVNELEKAAADKDTQHLNATADWESRLKAKDAELAKLGDEHGLKIGEIATLTAGAAATVAALKSKEDEIAALKAQVGDLEKAAADKDTQHLNATADWESRLKAKDDDVAKLNADLSAQLAAKDAELARLGDEHGSKLGEIATLTAGATAAIAALKGKDDEIASLTARVGELDAALSRKAELENKLISKDAEIARLSADWNARLKARDDELKAGVERANVEVTERVSADWRAQLAGKENELAQVRQKHGGSLAELAALTAGAAAAALAIRGKDDEIGALKIQINELNATLQAKEADLAGGNMRLMALQGDFDQFKVGVQQNDQAAAALRAHTDGLEAELQHGNYTRRLVETSLKARDGIVTELQTALADLHTTAANQGQQIALFAAGATSAASIIKDREVDLVEADARYAFLSKTASETSRCVTALKGELATKDKDWNDARWRIGELDAELGRLRDEHGGLSARFADTDQSFNDAQWRVGELEAIAAGKDKDVNDLRWRIGELEAELGAVREQRAQVDAQLAATTQGLDDAKARMGELEGELKTAHEGFAQERGDFGLRFADVDKVANDAKWRIGELEAAAAQQGAEADGLRGRIAELEAELKTAHERFAQERDDFGLRFAGVDKAANDAKWRIGELEGELKTAHEGFAQERGDFGLRFAGVDKAANDAKWRIGELEAAAAQQGAEADGLRGRVSELEVALNAAHAGFTQERSNLETRFAGVNKDVTDAKGRADELQSRLADAETRANQLTDQLTALTATARDKDKAANDLRQRVGELEAELANLKAGQSEAAASLTQRENDLTASQIRIGELEAIIATLRAGMVEPESATVPSIPPEPAISIQNVLDAGVAAELVAREVPGPIEPASLPAVPTGVEAEPAPTVFNLKKTFAAVAAQEAGVDVVSSECPQDLSEIDGIGSVFEQRLYDYGIGTYWEVAHMKDADLRTALKLDEAPGKGRSGNRVLQVNFEAMRADALRLATETQTQGRTWSGGEADDFEPIEGIGHVFELRLFNAGICTYEALISTDVARLAEVCKPPKRFKTPDYANWITQAKKLAAAKVKTAPKAASKIVAKPAAKPATKPAKSATDKTSAPKPVTTPTRKRTSK